MRSHIVQLDYELLRPGDSPVVFGTLAMQGPNRVGGHWMRIYDPPKKKKAKETASLQLTDGDDDDDDDGLPLLERSTPQGITIVRHPDFVTHGHTPGVGGVDHFSAFKGDFPAACLED